MSLPFGGINVVALKRHNFTGDAIQLLKHHGTYEQDDRDRRKEAKAEGVPGRHIAALQTLSREIDRAYGRHLTINATGAIAAVLGEIGIPQPVMRGIAVISRAAGLVGHIFEEREQPIARHIWDSVYNGVPYVSTTEGGL